MELLEEQVITVKDFMESGNQCSPDNFHWEPALPESNYWWWRLLDAWSVWQGKAIAIRQTTKKDLEDYR